VAEPEQRQKRHGSGNSGQEKGVSRNVDSLHHVPGTGLANGYISVNHWQRSRGLKLI
jgi:hypothetical protein